MMPFSVTMPAIKSLGVTSKARFRAGAPAGAPALNLAFDVTPNDLIAGIVTEKGIMEPPFSSSLKPYRQTQE